MKKECLSGSVDDALRRQNENSVPEELRGPWYHGTANRSLDRLTNKGPKVTWLTRSPAGGISWGPRVLTVYVIAPISNMPTDAGAGDDGGCDPENPSRKLPNWWLKVLAAEIECLMLIDECDCDKGTLDEKSLKETLTDDFYQDLRQRMLAIQAKESL